MDFHFIDWENCPPPPEGHLLFPNHPLYKLAFTDFPCPLPFFPIFTKPFPIINDPDPEKRKKLTTEAKIMGWLTFLLDNPQLHACVLKACIHRWYVVMKPFGRAVGPFNIYSPDVKPWDPSMGPWNAEMGPYDYMHPLNIGLPQWQPTLAHFFHNYIKESSDRYPLYPISPLVGPRMKARDDD